MYKEFVVIFDRGRIFDQTDDLLDAITSFFTAVNEQAVNTFGEEGIESRSITFIPVPAEVSTEPFVGKPVVAAMMDRMPMAMLVGAGENELKKINEMLSLSEAALAGAAGSIQ